MDKIIIELHETLKDLHQETIFSRKLDQFNRLFTLGFKGFYEEEKEVINNLKVLNRPLEWFKIRRNYFFPTLSSVIALTAVFIQLNLLTLEKAILLISIIVFIALLCYIILSIFIGRLEKKDMEVKRVFNRIKSYWAFLGSQLLTYSAIFATPDEKEIDQHIIFAVIIYAASTVEMINSLSSVVTPNQLEEWKRNVLSSPYTTEIILNKRSTIESSHLFGGFIKKQYNQYLAFIRENKN